MVVKAVARNVRITPEKLRLVVDEVKKMPPAKAVEILDFVPNKGSMLLKKVILSAVANAKHNHGLGEETLVFREIQVGKGIMFKRFRAGARGRARPIVKRTSNIRVVVESGEKVEDVQKVREVREVRNEKNETKVTGEPKETDVISTTEDAKEKNEK